MRIVKKEGDELPSLRIFSLDGKSAFITGASSGLGKEVAKGFDMAGASVFLVGSRIQPLQELADEFNSNGYTAYAYSADVSKSKDVQAAVKAAVDKFSQIDVLVNNAGTTWRSSIVDFDEEQ